MSELSTLPPRSWIPNAATGANIACGFVSMLFTAAGRFDVAVYLLVVAVLLDLVDGKLARKLNATSEFGKQVDGYCDLLSFGAAPALLAHQALLHELKAFGVGAVLVYLLAGVYRLARFTLYSDAHRKDSRTLGAPIPIGAGYLMAIALMRDRLDPWAALAVVLLISAAMVSRWRLPAFSGPSLTTATLGIGVLNYLAVVVWPGWPTVIWWNVWNVVILLVARREDRETRTAGP